MSDQAKKSRGLDPILFGRGPRLTADGAKRRREYYQKHDLTLSSLTRTTHEGGAKKGFRSMRDV